MPQLDVFVEGSAGEEPPVRRELHVHDRPAVGVSVQPFDWLLVHFRSPQEQLGVCLLYTSDAADES